MGLEFELVETGETARLRYDARDLMKLDPYRYVQHVRSSRRLDSENECRRNLEGMWLPHRLRLELLSGYFFHCGTLQRRKRKAMLREVGTLAFSFESRLRFVTVWKAVPLFFYSSRRQNVGENAWLMTG